MRMSGLGRCGLADLRHQRKRFGTAEADLKARNRSCCINMQGTGLDPVRNLAMSGFVGIAFCARALSMSAISNTQFGQIKVLASISICACKRL